MKDREERDIDQESAGVERTPDIHPKRRHLERPDLRRRKCASSTGGNCHGHETMPDDQRRGYKTHRQAHLPRNRAGGPRSHAEEPRAFLAARACHSPVLGVAGPQVGSRWEGKGSRAIRQAIVRRWVAGSGRGGDGTGEMVQQRRQALPFIFKEVHSPRRPIFYIGLPVPPSTIAALLGRPKSIPRHYKAREGLPEA